MYEFWYDSVKQKCSKKAKLCHINTDNLIVYIKKQMIFIKTLQKMLIDLILQIMK